MLHTVQHRRASPHSKRCSNGDARLTSNITPLCPSNPPTLARPALTPCTTAHYQHSTEACHKPKANQLPNHHPHPSDTCGRHVTHVAGVPHGRYREGVTWTNITLKPCVRVHLSLPASSSLLLEITVTVFTLDPRRGIVLRYVRTLKPSLL